MTLVNSAPLTFNFNLGSGSGVEIPVVLSSLYTSSSSFCIPTFDLIWDVTGTLSPYTNSDIQLITGGIVVNTVLPINKIVFVRASTQGTNTVMQEIRIEVCGLETLTLLDPT